MPNSCLVLVACHFMYCLPGSGFTIHYVKYCLVPVALHHYVLSGSDCITLILSGSDCNTRIQCTIVWLYMLFALHHVYCLVLVALHYDRPKGIEIEKQKKEGQSKF